MTEYTVELVDDGPVATLSVAEDETILEAAEAAGLEISTSCRAGACTSCVGRVLEGSVDQSLATGLDPTQLEDGYALLCVGTPESDCRVKIEVQDELFEF